MLYSQHPPTPKSPYYIAELNKYLLNKYHQSRNGMVKDLKELVLMLTLKKLEF